MDDITHDPEELEQSLRELEQMERDEKNRLVKEALGKFGFFLHTTGYLAGCAYLVLLGVFVRPALPYVFIPIGIWTGFLIYHGWRAWHPRTPIDKALKSLDEIESEEQEELNEILDAQNAKIVNTPEYREGLKLLGYPEEAAETERSGGIGNGES